MAARENTPRIPEVIPTAKAARPPIHTAPLQPAAASSRNQLSALAVLTFRMIPGSPAGETSMPLVKTGPSIIPTLTRELQNRAEPGEALKAAATHDTPHRPGKVSREADETAQRVWRARTRRFFIIKSIACPMPGKMERKLLVSFLSAERRIGSLGALRARTSAMARGMAESRAKVPVMPKVSTAKPRGATDTMAPRLDSPMLMAA